MKPVQLYYEVKTLFNTSEEAFDIFFKYKQREHKDFQIILCVCVSRNECQRLFRKALENLSIGNYNTKEQEIYLKDKVLRFKSIEEIQNDKEFLGRKYSEIKFLS